MANKTIPYDGCVVGPAVLCAVETQEILRKRTKNSTVSVELFRGLQAFLNGHVKVKSLSPAGRYILGEIDRFAKGKTLSASFENTLKEAMASYETEVLLKVFQIDFEFVTALPSDSKKIPDALIDAFIQYINSMNM